MPDHHGQLMISPFVPGAEGLFRGRENEVKSSQYFLAQTAVRRCLPLPIFVVIMNVHAFEPSGGFYHFSSTRVRASAHAHPLMELLVTSGEVPFLLGEEPGSLRPYHCTCVRANQKHCLHYDATEPLHLIFVERPELQLPDTTLARLAQRLREEAVLTSQVVREQLAAVLQAVAPNPDWDERAAFCRSFIDQHATELAYTELLPRLTEHCHLSSSRLTRVFRAATGTTLQRYFRWAKLKTAITAYLGECPSLTEAGFAGGFFDQPHFSRIFRELMGVSPSSHYNAGIVQVRDGEEH